MNTHDLDKLVLEIWKEPYEKYLTMDLTEDLELVERKPMDYAKMVAILLQFENMKTMYIQSIGNPQKMDHFKQEMIDLIANLPPELKPEDMQTE